MSYVHRSETINSVAIYKIERVCQLDANCESQRNCKMKRHICNSELRKKKHHIGTKNILYFKDCVWILNCENVTPQLPDIREDKYIKKYYLSKNYVWIGRTIV